jgi:hypothetical protein
MTGRAWPWLMGEWAAKASNRSSQQWRQAAARQVRRDELTAVLDAEPTVPDTTTLTDIADHIIEIINSGTDQTRQYRRTHIPHPPAKHDHDPTNTNKTLTSRKPPARATK